MSMLIRTGTLVRKPTRKSSVRRTRSAGSAATGSHGRPPDKGDFFSSPFSVPSSPVAKLQHLYTDNSLTSSPAKSSVTTTSTVVSFDDSRVSYETSPQDTVIQIEEASTEADNVCDFLCAASQIFCANTFVTSAVGLCMIVPVVMIVLGVKYLEECPLETKIPIFHMVGGCFGVLKIAVTLYRTFQRRHQGSTDNLYDVVVVDRGINTQTYRTMDILLSLFLLVWHILGSVWVFRIWKPRFKPLLHSPDIWCERSLYFFSIAIIVGVDAVIALILVGMICLVCVYRTSSRSGRVRGNS